VLMKMRSLRHLALLAGTELADDLVLAGDDAGQVNAHGAGTHAPFAGVAGVVGHLGAGDHGLGRRASGVDAGAAQLVFFNQGHVPALVGQVLRQRVAALAGADDDGIVGHEAYSWVWFRRENELAMKRPR
jgi:hypothetical protein